MILINIPPGEAISPILWCARDMAMLSSCPVRILKSVTDTKFIIITITKDPNNLVTGLCERWNFEHVGVDLKVSSTDPLTPDKKSV